MDVALSFLDFHPPSPSPKWIPAKVVFMGAQNYAMCSVESEVLIRSVRGGFETKFKETFAVPADILLGSCFRKTTIFDIEIRLPDFTISVAAMYPDKFPREVVAGGLVRINE